MPNNEPLVTIAIPAKNNAATIGETIESLRAQTHRNWALWVYDNASDDGTREVARAFNDARISVHEHPGALTMAENWQRCLSQIDGEFFQLLCADDVLEPRCLETKIRLAAKPENAARVLFTSNRRLISRTGRALFSLGFSRRARHAERAEVLRRIAHRTNPIGDPSTVLLRADAVKRESRPFTGQLTLDIDFWLRMLEQGGLCHLPETLSSFRLGGITSRSPLSDFREYLRFYRAKVKPRLHTDNPLSYRLGYAFAAGRFALRHALYLLFSGHPDIRRIVRFGLVGGYNTAFSYAAYALFIWFGLPYPAALFGSLVCAAVNNYLTFSRIVFPDRSRHRTVPLYLLGQALIYGFSVLTVGAFISIGFGEYLAGLFATPFIAIFSFCIENFVVFRKPLGAERKDTPGGEKPIDTPRRKA